MTKPFLPTIDKNYKKEIISQLILHKNTIIVTFTIILLSALMLTVSSNIVSSTQTSFAQVDNTRTSTAQAKPTTVNKFYSAFDTFVAPESTGGYGVYKEHLSNTFKPGEKIVLYIEPVGFSYQPIESAATTNNKTLYLMNFTADVVISNKSGQILAGFQNLPISQIVSHYKNKELNLVVSLSQSNPFPPGDYILKYIIHDKPSGNSFDITKNIKIV
jgi:hypothetical protein